MFHQKLQETNFSSNQRSDRVQRYNIHRMQSRAELVADSAFCLHLFCCCLTVDLVTLRSADWVSSLEEFTGRLSSFISDSLLRLISSHSFSCNYQHDHHR